MKRYFLAFSFSALLLVLAGCGSKTTDYHHIPGDAVSVAKVELPALVKKSNINYIRDSIGFGLVETAINFFGVPNILKNRSRTGIDFERNLYFFATDTTEEAPQVMMFYIADEDSLQSFITALDQGMFAEEKDVLTSINFSFGSIVYQDDRAYFSMNKEKATTALLGSYFTLEKSASLQEQEPAVVNYLQEQNDLGMWAQSRNLMTFENPLALTDEKEAIVKKSLVSLNFKKGAMTTNYSELGDEKLTSIYGQALEGQYQEKLIRGLPGGNLPAIISMHVKPATYQRQVAAMQWYLSLAEGNGYTLFTANRFAKMMQRLEPAFSGTSVWAMTGAMKQEQAGETSKGIFGKRKAEEVPSWHIAIELAKPQMADSVLQSFTGTSFGALKKQKSFYAFEGTTFPFLLSVEDDILYISNDENHLQNLLTKDLSAPAFSGNINEEMEKYPVYMNVSPDVWNTLMNTGDMDRTTGIITSMLGNALMAADRISVKGYSTEDTALRVDLEMSLKNKDRNALELLLTSLMKKLSFESLKGVF